MAVFTKKGLLTLATQERQAIGFVRIAFLFVKARRMNYHLKLPGQFEKLVKCQGDLTTNDLTTKDHVAYRSICIISLNTSKVFHRFSMPLSKVIAETTTDDLS